MMKRQDMASSATPPSPTNFSQGRRASHSATTATTTSTTTTWNSKDVETPAFLQRSLQHFHDAIALLPLDQALEYHTAWQVAPHLFQEEVNILAFLRSEDYNPWAAAHKITLYWKNRKQAFGDTQWLLPLAQSTQYGALTEMDRHMLRAGYCILHDKVGILDWSRLTTFARQSQYSDDELEQARMRLMIYLITVTANEYTQRVGKDFIVTVTGITIGKLWKVKNIWPTKIRSIHLVVLPHRIADRCTAYWTKFLMDGLLRYFATCPNLIIASSKQDMWQKLQQVGFQDASIIPQELGGTWSYDQVDEWMQQLAQKDDERNQRTLLGNMTTNTALLTNNLGKSGSRPCTIECNSINYRTARFPPSAWSAKPIHSDNHPCSSHNSKNPAEATKSTKVHKVKHLTTDTTTNNNNNKQNDKGKPKKPRVQLEQTWIDYRTYFS